MAKFRNSSDDTVLDYLTQQVAEPDEVITVDDDIAVHYLDHPVWDCVEAPAETEDESDADSDEQEDNEE